MTAAEEDIAVVDLEEAKRLAAEFEALSGGALTMALAQEAVHGGLLARLLARTRAAPRVGGPLVNLAEILTARADVTAEAVGG